MVRPLFFILLSAIASGKVLPEEKEFFKTNAPRRLKDNDEIVLVRVIEEHSQIIDNHRNRPFFRSDEKGVVLKNIKGEWKAGETINFFLEIHEGDYSAFFKTDNKEQGELLMSYFGRVMYLFLDKADKNKPVLLDTGCEWPYSAELETIFDSLEKH